MRETLVQVQQLVLRAQDFHLGEKTVSYLNLCGEAIEYRRAGVEKWITDVCPECGYEVNADLDDHSALELEDGTVVLLIGCEGAFILNPNAVGMDSPNWQDWTTY